MEVKIEKLEAENALLKEKLAVAVEALDLWETDFYTFYEMQPKIREAIKKIRG
jgi:hypothetical protein